ncbi:MAG TPA: DUF262 domain-containing HNH endonuclease family protein [Burkholderiales bacterium]|nr:DUF262 domain-containing HNH endonuclease family protein [Burkholderiales bacterium]
MHIQPVFATLSQLLAGKLFRIPQYQRAYSWSRKQRQDLFHDIEKIYKSGNGIHFLATMVGLRRGTVPIAADEFLEIDVVDGQQRLTTLILLFKTIAIALHASEDQKEKKLGGEIQRLLVKGDDLSLLLLQTNHDSSHICADFLRDGAVPNEGIALIAADQNIVDAIQESNEFVNKWINSKRSLTELVALLRNRLAVIFHEIDDERLVYTVFEVLNSRGLDVTWFDKLKSFLMAIAFEHGDAGSRTATIDELHNLWRDIYRTIGKKQNLNKETVQFAGTLKARVQPNRPMSEEAAVLELVDQCGKSAKKAVDCTKWLLKVTQVEDLLLADVRLRAVTNISQARLVAIAILLKNFPSVIQEKLLRRWENVTFRIYTLKEYDSRQAVGEYIRLAWRIHNDSISPNQILDALSDIGRIAPLKDAVKGIWNVDWYGYNEAVRYFLYRYDEHLAKAKGQKLNESQWNKIWHQEPAKSIEHIKPQASRVGYLHRLGNLTMLPPSVNSSLQDKDPSSKKETYRGCGLLGTAEVASLIEKAKWSVTAVEKREKKFMKWALKEWAD